MSKFNDYFDLIYVINRDCRTDRRQHVMAQVRKYDLPLEKIVWFRAFEGDPSPFEEGGTFNGNRGCTASHRAILDEIAGPIFSELECVLVLEDDFEIVEPDPSKPWQHDNHSDRTLPFHEQFDAVIGEVPDDWEMLYLGGHYAEKPQQRVSKHVIRTNAMLTTSSYAIRPGVARRMAPHIFGIGPIDTLYGAWNRILKCYCLQPRLMVQYTSKSDLNGEVKNNAIAMLDPNHEKMV